MNLIKKYRVYMYVLVALLFIGSSLFVFERDGVKGSNEKHCIEAAELSRGVPLDIFPNQNFQHFVGEGERAGEHWVADRNSGVIVYDPKFVGTYNYGEPGTVEHIMLDVEPWIEWGNSPDDVSTKGERIEALKSYAAGRSVLKCLGIFE